ncbi:MAG: hypothetical protein CUN55_11630 [Phototrophicales bacterium]|nr:MAG: hypothetical protein CUN55_11630 [Phototrophicales bacterium]
MTKKRFLLITLGLLIIGMGFIIWYLFIRDIEAEENKIAAPALSQNVENPCAAPTEQPESTLPADESLIVATPEILLEENSENYLLYVFDTDESVINFTIAEVPSINGTFDMFGHWFEFIKISDEEGWCATLWLDIDGQSVDTGNEVTDNLIRLGFQAEKYPVGRFVGAATELIQDLSAPNTINIAGQIELSGVVRSFTVPVEVTINGEQLIASSNIDINANDFGANLPGGATLDSKIRVVANRTDPSTIDLPVLPTAIPSEIPSE